MPPPTAEPLAARILLGPALRTQSDSRLVRLVREGYEAAFEEIVRRYRRPLDRFAAAIVGPRSEDVTQDAFSKALLALRGSEAEIELRPWLYRIVRNTALNDLRDRPPATEELAEVKLDGGASPDLEVERREEMTELMQRLRALPEPQRAALVMRELEGLSHGEIAAALGVSGGAARQAIHRARTALRDGAGLLLPLPLLRVLLEGGGEVAGGAATAGGGALGGLGGAAAAKIGVATVLVAGSLGAGLAVQHQHGGGGPEPAEAATRQAGPESGAPGGAGAQATATVGEDGAGRGGAAPAQSKGDGGAGDQNGGSGSGSGESSGASPVGGSTTAGQDGGEERGSGSHPGHGEDGHSGAPGPGGSGGPGASHDSSHDGGESHDGSSHEGGDSPSGPRAGGGAGTTKESGSGGSGPGSASEDTPPPPTAQPPESSGGDPSSSSGSGGSTDLVPGSGSD